VKTLERSNGEYTPTTYSHLPPREVFVDDKADTPLPVNDNMTPSHDNLTSSKTPDMGDLAHPKAPRPLTNDAKKFTFDCISSFASINVSDSRDVQNSKSENVDAMEEDKVELRDVPMETAAEATEDDTLELVEDGVGSDGPTVAGLMITLKIDDDGKTAQRKSGQWCFCGMDPTELLTLTSFGASMNYLATASAGAETSETQPNGKEYVPFVEELVTTKCQDKVVPSEAKIDHAVAETLKAVCDSLENLEGGNEESESMIIGSHGPEAVATAKRIAPVSIVTLRFVDTDIEMAPSDEMENRSALVSPASQKSTGLRNEMRENGDVSFDNLKAFQAYV
jgi:hypothetical protein